MKNLSRIKFGNDWVLFVIAGFFAVFCISSFAFAKEWQWPNTLTFGSQRVGGSGYATMSAWVPVFSQMTGVKARIMPEGSMPVRARWIKNGKLDFNMDAISGCIEGNKGFATKEGGPFQIRVVWLGQLYPFGFIVRKDSDIKTVYDIKPGHRIASFTRSSRDSSGALLAWAKVSKKDVTIVPYANFNANIKSVPEGKADVAYCIATSPATVEAESSPSGIRWIPLDAKKDPEGAKRYLEIDPTAVFAPCQQGVKSAFGVPMIIKPFNHYTTADKDSKLVYNLAKWLHKNYDSYKNKHPNCKLMSLDVFRQTLDTAILPTHNGTIKYLKEIGKWSAEDDVRQMYNVSIVTRYEKAYNAAIAEAEKKGIKMDPTNEKWMNLWAQFKKDIPPLKAMTEIPRNF